MSLTTALIYCQVGQGGDDDVDCTVILGRGVEFPEPILWMEDYPDLLGDSRFSILITNVITTNAIRCHYNYVKGSQAGPTPSS